MYKYIMSSKIPPRDNYYLHNGTFILRTRWSKWIRNGILASIIIFGSFMTATAKYYHFDSGSVGVSFAVKESALLEYVQQSNKSLTKTEAIDIVLSLVKWADKFKLDVALIFAVAKQESKFDKHAISSAGAFGIMQVIPSWHIDKIVKAKQELNSPELFDVNTNAFLGAWVLRDCINKFKNVNSGLLCYNGSNANPNGYDKKVIAYKQEIDRILKNI